MEKKMQTMSIRMPLEKHEVLRKMSYEQRVSISQIVNRGIDRMLKSGNARKRQAQKGK